ncbi:hypothetical protein HDU99_008634, partial [Rhizoclosmatium hyalinum]
SKPAIVQHEAHPDHALTNLDFGLLKANSKTRIPFFIRALKTTDTRNIHVSVNFKMLHTHSPLDQDDAGDSELLESQYRFRKVETFKISCVKALDAVFVAQPRAIPLVAGKAESGAEAGLLMQLLKNPGSDVMQECGWTLTGTVTAQAPCELIIREAQFIPANVFGEGVVKVDVKGVDLKKEDVEVKLGDSRNYIFHMVVTLDLLRPLSESVIGSLAVDWKR